MGTKVTAKVVLQSKQEMYGGIQLSFLPDYADGRNKEWAVATPNLSLSMTVKPEVAEMFETGSAYTLSFEKNVE